MVMAKRYFLMRPSRLHSAPVLAALVACLAGSASLVASPAIAQTTQLSEAERKAAARSLFQQGVKEQDLGHHADALALFLKAQKLFDAPTHLLHIAQCQVLTGKLVDAAETYETLKRVTLTPGAPDVFVQAKTQAEAELPGVRARIPNLKIDLSPKPEQLRNLQLVVNDVLLPPELVGVARPVNPGVAKIVARADGYAATTLEVTIKERETRSVALSLSPGSSQPVVVPGMPSTQPQNPQQVPPPPPVYGTEQPKEPPKPLSSSGIIAGVHVGAIGQADSNSNSDAGLAGGADFLFRFAKVVLVGATLQGGSISNVGTYFAGARISFLTHPEKLAFTAGALGGWRGTRATGGGTFGGTLGLSIPIGTHFRLEPRLDVTATSFNDQLFPFFFIGLGGAYNHNFAPKPEGATK